MPITTRNLVVMHELKMRCKKCGSDQAILRLFAWRLEDLVEVRSVRRREREKAEDRASHVLSRPKWEIRLDCQDKITACIESVSNCLPDPETSFFTSQHARILLDANQLK
jgi:hypothetical protein